jgi:alkanesulfonate monooxygenase SsuD/methylene tetrahydromethanopterin reductase-like flavin-dependent oxidoreductase (luciferase family)
MKFGSGFALTAQADPIALRNMAQTLDGAGFDYVTTAGHLLCAPPDVTGAQALQRIIEVRQAQAAAGY